MADDVSQELLEAGRGYEALFVPALFKPWTRFLLDGAGVGAGDAVLDIACGTGVLARDALATAGNEGRVVGLDAAPGMLAAAGEIEPGIEWVLGSAESLDFADATFDRVVTQFGLMFFADRGKAAAEMHRVLKPGGSLAVAVWNSVEANPAYADIISLLAEHVGEAAADALRLPFNLGDASGLGPLFESAGFEQVSVTTESELARFPSHQQMLEAELRGWLPLFDILLDDAEIDRILQASDGVLSKYADESGRAIFPTSAHIITGARGQA